MRAFVISIPLLLVSAGCGANLVDSGAVREAVSAVKLGASEAGAQPSCVTASSEPACDGTLSRIAHNSIRVVFSDDVAAAQLDSIDIRPLLANGQFGGSISSEFQILDEGNGVVVLTNTGIWLENATWYAVTDTCNQFNFVVKYGDVDGDGDTDALDVNAIWRNAGSDDPLFDVNGDGAVDLFDAQLTWKYRDVHVPPTPDKPSGHDCQ